MSSRLTSTGRSCFPDAAFPMQYRREPASWLGEQLVLYWSQDG